MLFCVNLLSDVNINGLSDKYFHTYFAVEERCTASRYYTLKLNYIIHYICVSKTIIYYTNTNSNNNNNNNNSKEIALCSSEK